MSPALSPPYSLPNFLFLLSVLLHCQPPSPKCCFLDCKLHWLLSRFNCHFIILVSFVFIVNVVRSLEACNTKSVESTMSARKIRDYNNCCVFGIDQYWTCKKKILLFACYSIGILKLISGNSSSHPEYRPSEIFLSLYFFVPADCVFKHLHCLGGGEEACFLHLFSSLSFLALVDPTDRLVTAAYHVANQPLSQCHSSVSALYDNVNPVLI